jgi:hypothetical protein
MAKTVPQSKLTEWKGLDRLTQVVHGMKCIWREISKDDFGIDGEIEVVVPKPDGKGLETLGNIIKVQAKSGSSYVVQDSPTSFATPVIKEDLDLWAACSYPMLFIVYHPRDDRLYCKEIREYVRSTRNVFQHPLRVVFNKATDTFDTTYFDAIRQHAKVSQPRVSLLHKERLYSNLLTVRRLPALTHASTSYKTTDDIRAELSGDWPPFCVLGDRLFTLGDLRYEGCVLRLFCDGDIEALTASEWLTSDPERQGDFIFLLNQLLGKLQRHLNLRYSRAFDRTYFPRDNDTDMEFRRSWFNVRSQQHAERLVVKYYKYGFCEFWRHLACHLSFLRVSDAWFLRIIPKYFFTTDGDTPCDSDLVGPYTTKLKAMERNLHVLNHVLFWADTLAQGKDYISCALDHHMVLNIDRQPMTGLADFAILDDPATFEEKGPLKQLDLFRSEVEDEDD